MDRINSQRGNDRDDRAPRPRADRVAPYKIIVVEPNPDIVEILVSSLSRRLNAHITCVADAESCLDLDLVDPRHLIITEMDLTDSDGIELAERLRFGHLMNYNNPPFRVYSFFRAIPPAPRSLMKIDKKLAHAKPQRRKERPGGMKTGGLAMNSAV